MPPVPTEDATPAARTERCLAREGGVRSSANEAARQGLPTVPHRVSRNRRARYASGHSFGNQRRRRQQSAPAPTIIA